MEYRSLLRSIKLSPPIQWFSMARKAMKDAKRQSARNILHKAKFKAMQKSKAKVVNKKLLQAQAEDSCSEEVDHVIQDGQEKEHEEEQQEEQEGECQQHETAEKDETKVSGKPYNHFWKSLPEAPRAVQVAVKKVKGQPKRLADMAKAYAKQRWDHKLFKSIETLQQEKAQARGDIVMPEVIMVAKCRGKAAAEEAACLVNRSVIS